MAVVVAVLLVAEVVGTAAVVALDPFGLVPVPASSAGQSELDCHWDPDSVAFAFELAAAVVVATAAVASAS